MSDVVDPVRARAQDLLVRAPTWHAFRRLLDAEGLTDRLGADGMLALLAAWNRRAAAALSDIELRVELGFWADGGSYASHLRGFQAIPPADLVAEARARGWFVRIGDSGKGVVNPPDGKPLVINLGPTA